MQQLKKCGKCQQDKPIGEFPKSGIQKGVQYYKAACKQCSLSNRGRRRKELLTQGLIECATCKASLPFSEFYDDLRKSFGKKSVCKKCFADAVLAYRKTEQGQQVQRNSKQRYRSSEKGRQTQSEYARQGRKDKRWYWHERARKFVQEKIRRKGFPKASMHLCVDCNAQAEEYHHESYEREHWLDVVPLCIGCHQKRHSTSMEVQP